MNMYDFSAILDAILNISKLPGLARWHHHFSLSRWSSEEIDTPGIFVSFRSPREYYLLLDYNIKSKILLIVECEMWVGSVTNWVKPEQENNSNKISWTPSRGYSKVDHLILGRLKSPKIILLHDGWMRHDSKLFKLEYMVMMMMKLTVLS